MTRLAKSNARWGLPVEKICEDLKSCSILPHFIDSYAKWTKALSTSACHTKKTNLGWYTQNAITFCQGNRGMRGVSIVWDVKINSWQAMAASWKDTCTPQSTWIEYEGTLKCGRGLWNMSQWALRASQYGWEIQCWVFWQLTVAKSNGPWMNVSWCVKLTIYKMEVVCAKWHNPPKNQTVKEGVCLL